MCMDTTQCDTKTMTSFSLAIQILMIVLFSLLLLFVIIQLIRIYRYGTSFVTRTIFFLLILCFCIGRVAYFSLTLFEQEVSMPPSPNEILHIITEFCYHWSSAFFYCAFAVLTIHFGENLLVAGGFSRQRAVKSTKQAKMTAFLFMIYLHLCQIVLFTVMAVYMHKDDQKRHIVAPNKTGTSICYVLQFCFDGAMSWLIVVFFAVWIYKCTRNLWGDVLAQNEERVRFVSKLRIASVIFCLLLILKGLGNYIFAIYQADCAWMCPPVQIIIYGLCAIAFDFLPLFIVVLVFALPMDNIRDSTDLTNKVTIDGEKQLLIPTSFHKSWDNTGSSSVSTTPHDYEEQEEE
jgi:hypothetical protein